MLRLLAFLASEASLSFKVLLLAAISLFTCAGVWGQSTSSGTISGQVSDDQGAAIPGASVRLIDEATKTPRTVLTNSDGRYDVFNLNPGLYEVSVVKPGFAETKFPGQTVDVGLVLTLNVTLRVGSTSTTIEVAASAGAELQTTNATVGSTISGVQLHNLPNLGQDANSLFTLQPGVSPNGNVAGSVSDQNQYQLDGGNNSSDMDGNQAVYTLASGTINGNSTGGTPSGVIPTPIETIEEFKVGTANQTADFNGSAGGQVQMVTKRGTSQFHGAAYEFLLSSYFSANTWKNDHTPSHGLPYTPLPKTHQNRYGVSAGGPLTPRVLGGKTYFFFNYEARRFPQATTIERQVPSALLRAGIIQLPNTAGVYQAYNLNNHPVTVGGTTYQPAACPAGACDPRGLGLNPIVSKIWSFMPPANDPQFGDLYNTQGYLVNVGIPQQSDEFTGRVDHDFGDKWHLMTSYRYFKLNQNTTNQTDIGGLLGGSLGTAVATAPRDQKPGYWVAGLTTTITPTLTNDVHYSYLRNFWQWGTDGAPPQLPGLGGAVEIGGETAGNLNALIPYNVNSQNVRQRFWDGQDHLVRDDLSWVKGNHLLQFGGSFQHNFNFHTRDDNGAGVFNNTVYQVGGATSGINFQSQYIPANLPANQIANWNNFYTEVLGIVSQPQVLYTRAGANLTLQPLGTNLFDKVNIPYYNEYFSDTWRMRKSFTLTYGLGYQIEMPPTEETGSQVILVDSSGKEIDAQSYLNSRKQAALQGQVYNPILGTALIHNIPGQGYIFKPFYGGLSPRIAAAWNPNFSDGILGKLFGGSSTVIRGGYSRLYGRLNGVGLVLNPILGAGLAQPVQCIGASSSGACLGGGGVNANTAFRIGTDGLTAPLPSVSQTLAQPFYPGVNGNAAAGDGTYLDRNFKPNRSDEFDFTIQRQLSSKLSLEAGYIGRILKNEFQLINLDAVPTMTTLNGQSYANAFGNLYTELSQGQAIQAQPFFESVMGGSGSAYCRSAANCTAAVVANQKNQITGTQAYSLWTALSKSPSWTFGRTLLDSAPAQTASLYETTSLGWGNYNGIFLSFTFHDWHGLTARSNFTYSRTFGTVGLSQSTSSTTVLNPWDLHSMYGPQPFDIPLVYNLSLVYSPKIFENKRLLHAFLGGWTLAPLFTAQSGTPLEVNINGGGTYDCQSFGESNCSSDSTYENAVLVKPYTGGTSAHENITSATTVASAGNASKGGSGLNMFADPNAVYSEFGRLVLGVNENGGGAGILRNLPTWNLDMQVSKDFAIPVREGMGLTFTAQFSNLMNHFQPGSTAPASTFLSIDNPTTFGVINTQANTPRQVEFGLRLHF